jgi:hypothetical protein
VPTLDIRIRGEHLEQRKTYTYRGHNLFSDKASEVDGLTRIAVAKILSVKRKTNISQTIFMANIIEKRESLNITCILTTA